MVYDIIMDTKDGEEADVMRIVALLDAKDREREQAVKDAVKATVEKCATTAEKEMRCWRGLVDAPLTDCEQRGIDAIRKLNAPPVPVWQHKPGCPTPYQWTKHAYNQEWWCCPDLAGKPLLKQCANFCDGCGSAKPTVTT
jgi:hypothetical protein